MNLSKSQTILQVTNNSSNERGSRMGLRLRHGRIGQTVQDDNASVFPPKHGVTREPSSFRFRLSCCLVSIVVLGVAACIMIGFAEHWLMNQSQDLLRHNTTLPHGFNHSSFTRLGGFERLEVVPHDTSAFTQGLLVARCQTRETETRLCMYEGTGLHGSSQLRQLDVRSGRPIVHHALPSHFFGEGIAHYYDTSEPNVPLRLVQLTWREQTAFEYLQSRSSDQRGPLTLMANFTYNTTTGEGWGITHNAHENVFYVSDGSYYLHTWDVSTKSHSRKVAVRYQFPDMARPVRLHSLNELEWDPFTRTVLANVWKEDVIVRINPYSGMVETMYDLRALWPKARRSWRGHDVLNGIALTYDAAVLHSRTLTAEDSNEPVATDQVWVTGKCWPNMYRIRLVS